MTADEAQANLDSIIGIIIVFGKPARVLSDFGACRSFISTSFASLRERILHTSVFKGCEILVKGVVLKANLIPLEMYDFDMILGMDWLCKTLEFMKFDMVSKIKV